MIFAFYAVGVIVFAYLALYHIKETEYFNGEDDVIVPKHVIEELKGNESTPGDAESGEKVAVESYAVPAGDQKN